jgi:hypothetical protein
MRCMIRNKVRFFYALYERREPVMDEYQNVTGDHDVIHANPKEFFANVSAANGKVVTEQFGENVVYDKVIVMGNDAPPIDEYTVFWIDTVPQLEKDGSLSVDDDGAFITPHDYVVKKVARSLNSMSIAISKVTVS